MLAGVFAKLKTSAAGFAASFDEIRHTHITRLLQLDSSTTNKNYEKNRFHSNGYVTEEEALKDPPLNDVRMTVSIAKSSVKLKGDPFSVTENKLT